VQFHVIPHWVSEADSFTSDLYFFLTLYASTSVSEPCSVVGGVRNFKGRGRPLSVSRRCRTQIPYRSLRPWTYWHLGLSIFEFDHRPTPDPVSIPSEGHCSRGHKEGPRWRTVIARPYHRVVCRPSTSRYLRPPCPFILPESNKTRRFLRGQMDSCHHPSSSFRE